jgi:periplasmic protein TonB
MKQKLLSFIAFICISFAAFSQVDTAITENKSDVEKAFLMVEEPATFKGGDASTFCQWVSKHVEYPKECVEKVQMGKVIIQFRVSKTGDVTHVTVLKSSGFELLDAEAVRVVSSSPKWKPAKQGGKNVIQQFNVPISFYLAE